MKPNFFRKHPSCLYNWICSRCWSACYIRSGSFYVQVLALLETSDVTASTCKAGADITHIVTIHQPSFQVSIQNNTYSAYGQSRHRQDVLGSTPSASRGGRRAGHGACLHLRHRLEERPDDRSGASGFEFGVQSCGYGWAAEALSGRSGGGGDQEGDTCGEGEAGGNICKCR